MIFSQGTIISMEEAKKSKLRRKKSEIDGGADVS